MADSLQHKHMHVWTLAGYFQLIYFIVDLFTYCFSWLLVSIYYSVMCVIAIRFNVSILCHVAWYKLWLC